MTKTMQLRGPEKDEHISSALDHVLIVIGVNKSLTIKNLAQVLCITSGAATQHVIALEKFGMVERSQNPDDRRETFVSLTGKGKVACEKIEHTHTAFIKEAFSALSDAELKEFSRILEKILITNKQG